MIAARTRTAIELAWFQRVSVHSLALKYKLKANAVRAIWHRAKDRGDLPKVTRPSGGPTSQPQREHLLKIKKRAA